MLSIRRLAPLCALLLLPLFGPPPADASHRCSGRKTVSADVIALDQPWSFNRFGAIEPQGMIFALARDVEPVPGTAGGPGKVQLRSGKRPRPLVLRMNAGDCLKIRFRNWLDTAPRHEEQPATRAASIHIMGLDLVRSIADDGSYVGRNPSSLVAPGDETNYLLAADREGAFLLYSTGATTGGEGDGGSLSAGLFGALVVEPRGAVWFRSQVTADDLSFASRPGTPDPAGGEARPRIDWQARYPAGHPRAGSPVLAMLDQGEIVHSDLTAIIAGGGTCGKGSKGAGPSRFCPGTYRDTPVLPDRLQPFREFVTIYHDESGAVQAFPQFDEKRNPELAYTLHGVRDGFSINYGSSGAGSVILANRLGLGPAKDCVECKYEEFFLTSWASGDPALVVDNPVNSGAAATRALYPDDPSNVYHSYLSDHVKFRVLHGGPKEHHIHHQHAHQWPHTPDSPNSSYLDSQAIGPGSAHTLEITYGGSGNLNLTPGDSIFHCHFYPHFAQGMWALWRVHDVFEAGTRLDGAGRPAAGSRALPDGEIATGTPIPAVVPLPTLAMAPLPTADIPGYPFFMEGLAGHRPPHPPLDTVDDGGLPRHRILSGTSVHAETRLDFSKSIVTASAEQLPEAGTPVERRAMEYHAQREHPSVTPEGHAGLFLTNGRPAVAGAPIADPCSKKGKPVGLPRTYKAAAFELDAVFNKVGWHYPQWRMLALWDDVSKFLARELPPAPFFFRANSNDCVTFHHTVLTPKEMQQDDFQVRAPTDILGQHIHLVKFDVLASDGAGNGWNYEDGTFSPEEVVERIDAIRAGNLCTPGDPRDGSFECPVARPHPVFGAGPHGEWLGAQTTIQRWYADPLLDGQGKDKTLRTVFTHDHFAPSTHQQAGLYAGLVIEPEGSIWRHPESGEILGGRPSDGGPTLWRANIETPNPMDSYREFLLAYQDDALAYDGSAEDRAVNPPGREEADLPIAVQLAATCPGGGPRPCPEAVTATDVGTMLVNYRNEPIPLRVRDPESGNQAEGEAGDLAYVFSSLVPRSEPRLEIQPTTYPPLTLDLDGRDPYTPVLRAYEGDRIEIRTLAGAHEEGHNFSLHGAKWLFEPNDPNSGFRSSQMAGLSEHFELELPPLPRAIESQLVQTDRLVAVGSSVDDLWNGLWGILRTYRAGAGVLAEGSDRLVPLPNNPKGVAPFANRRDFQRRPSGEPTGPCPAASWPKKKDWERIVAVTARDVLPAGAVLYNPRTTGGGALSDPTAILYVRASDLDSAGRLKPGVPIEPLVLRGRAGDCMVVELENRLPEEGPPDLPGWNTMPMLIEGFNANQVAPSSRAGLHAGLVAFDAALHDGVPVGINPLGTTADPGETVTYVWYLGSYDADADGVRRAKPIEFGAVPLSPADPIKHSNKGAIGALIVEPAGSHWKVDAATRTTATVYPHGGKPFREFVVMFQDDLNLRRNGEPVKLLAGEEDPEDSGQKAFNYRSEPFWQRLGYEPETPLTTTRTFDFADALSNTKVGGDPVTPIFTAVAGTPIRFRVVEPAGHQRNHVFQVHGHRWPEEPYVGDSTRIGTNPLSEWRGSQEGIGPSSHFDFVIPAAGGAFEVPGDYLFRDQQSFQFDGGLWGVLRVKRCDCLCRLRRWFGSF